MRLPQSRFHQLTDHWRNKKSRPIHDQMPLATERKAAMSREKVWEPAAPDKTQKQELKSLRPRVETRCQLEAILSTVMEQHPPVHTWGCSAERRREVPEGAASQYRAPAKGPPAGLTAGGDETWLAGDTGRVTFPVYSKHSSARLFRQDEARNTVTKLGK
ncbi:hypothetical protein E5288_WYG011229 [Bos mutus]|uniref:Uncharacterized protein n=1 Tax=Bos mutus TaxID=72004 RepID=A0A6B0R944_9CETA|nr:hypothetical protein [Bos mutus]